MYLNKKTKRNKQKRRRRRNHVNIYVYVFIWIVAVAGPMAHTKEEEEVLCSQWAVGSGQGEAGWAPFLAHFDLHLAGNPSAFQSSNYANFISLPFHVFSSNLSLVFKRGLLFFLISFYFF